MHIEFAPLSILTPVAISIHRDRFRKLIFRFSGFEAGEDLSAQCFHVLADICRVGLDADVAKPGREDLEAQCFDLLYLMVSTVDI